jgi:hypothetical protein
MLNAIPCSSPADALTYMDVWWEDEDQVSMFGLPSRRSVVTRAATLRDVISVDGLDGLVWNGVGGGGSADNVYMGVNPVRGAVRGGGRGGRNNVASVRGIVLDIDGARCDNKSVDAARVLHARLPATMVVDSGGGGVHMYWRVASASASASMSGEMGRGLWLWAQRELGCGLDSVHNVDRVLRLPGTIHLDTHNPVRVLFAEKRELDLDMFRNLVADVWQEWYDGRTRTRQRVAAEERIALIGWAGRWGMADLNAMMEAVPWADILEPAGWRRVSGPDREGRVTWQRPGEGGVDVSERSAVVDWVESPHVMSLLSTSPHTGLADLREADIPLTKTRVAARLHYGDDYRALLSSLNNNNNDRNRFGTHV